MKDKKNCDLPTISIESELKDYIDRALQKLNGESRRKITLSDFRRMCYECLSKEILSGERTSERFLLRKNDKSL